MSITTFTARSRRPFARPALPAALLAAALLAAPAAAHAQFTTAVQPPARRAEPATVAAAESVVVARRDSVVQQQRLDLRAWVDSAAGALAAGQPPAPAVPAADSMAAQPPAAAPVTGTRPAEGTVEFREGAPAPDTATPLPLLLLIGGGATLLGARLRKRR